MKRPSSQRGFTLLEVVIALGILAMSLTVLLESQAASVSSAGRSRDLTIATLLARSKMVDIEVAAIEDGFTLGDVEEEGDFSDDGFEDYKWKTRLLEIKIELSGLMGLCEGFMGSEGDDEGGGGEDFGDCESMMGGLDGFGGALTTFTDEMGNSLRLAEVTVTWPVGRYEESIQVRSFVTNADFSLSMETGLPR